MVGLDHLAGDLVAQHAARLDEGVAPLVRLDVGAAHAARAHADQDLAGAYDRPVHLFDDQTPGLHVASDSQEAT